MKNKIIISIIILISFLKNIYGQTVQWPVYPTSNQGNITGTVGEYRNTPSFHMGLDITSSSSNTSVCYNIYAINSGLATVIQNGINSYIQVGSANDFIRYIHIDPAGAVLTAYNSGQTISVNVGDLIGVMVTQASIHLHLQDYNINYIAQHISPFIDNAAPTFSANFIPNGIQFYRNPLLRTTAIADLPNRELNQQVLIEGQQYAILYNKIDIGVHANEPRTSSNGNSGGGQCAPNRISWVLRNSNNQDLIINNNFDFTTMPINNAAHRDACFHPQSAGIGDPTIHIITNCPNCQNNYDRYFNSGLRINTTETWPDPVNTTLDAHFKGDAQYIDGKYQIIIRASDVSFANNPQNTVERTVNVLLDNFRPYIEKVEIFRQGEATAVYSRVWTWNGTQLVFGTVPSNPICDNSKNLSIKITTSEPMQEVRLTAFGLAQITQTTPSNTNRKEWTFSFTSTQIQTGNSALSITGNDLAGNPIAGFTSTSPVTTFPIHQNNGTWIPAPNVIPDGVHTFNIEPATAGTPTNVAASTNFTNKIIVIWDPVPGATHYNVYRSLSNNSASATSISGWLTSNNFVDLNVTPEIVYYYWIKAAKSVNGDNSSAFSSPASGSVLSNLQVNFSYNQVSYAPNYKVDFIDNSVGDDLKSWSWNFGDGSTSTSQNPSHNYSRAATYNVSLSVTDKYNITKTKSSSINVIDNFDESISITTNRWALSDYEYEFIVSIDDPDVTHLKSITISFGDGGSSNALNNTPVRHKYAEPANMITYLPYASVTIKNNLGQTIYQKLVNISEITLYHPVYPLNLSITPQNLSRTEAGVHITPGSLASFTGSSSNGIGNIQYVWLINTEVDELNGTCNANSDANCYSFVGTTSGSCPFPTAGNYKIVLWAYDEAGNSGYLEFILNVADIKDNCILVDFFTQTPCATTYEFAMGSELQLLDWATTRIYACQVAGQYMYADIKAINWYYDNSLIKSYVFTKSSKYCNYFNECYYSSYNPGCFHLLTEGLHTIRIDAYGGSNTYNWDTESYDLEYAPGNPFSSATKNINVINYNSQIDIKSTPISSFPDYSNGLFQYGYISCGGGSIIQNIPSGKTITFNAYNSILLKNGFKAAVGSHFIANPVPMSNLDCSCYPSQSILLRDEFITHDSRANKISLKVFPNPTTSRFTIEIIGNIINAESISINTITGKQILYKYEGITNTNELNIDNLPAGIYIIRVNTNGITLMDKVIKN